MKIRESHLLLIYLIGDILLLNLSILQVAWLWDEINFWDFQEIGVYLFYGNSILVMTYLLLVPKYLLLPDRFWDQVKRITLQSFVFIIISALIAYLFIPDRYYRSFIVYYTVLFYLIKLCFYWLVNQYFSYNALKELNITRSLILGFNETGIQLRDALEKEWMLGYKVIGFVCNQCQNGPQLLGRPEDLAAIIDKHRVQMVFLTLSEFGNPEQGAAFLKICNDKGARLWFVLENQRWIKRDFNTAIIGDLVLINPHRIPLDNIYLRLEKRAFDILFSFLVLILIAPWLFPLIAVLIKLSSKGPVFFVQKRTGFNNKTFWCYKFRSMQLNLEADEKQSSKNDPRKTWVGRFLRQTNLDEFPQFFNVLLGNMSVVGPRPHMLKHTEQYAQLVDRYLTRHFVKPGITGWAQVNGLRGETTELWMMKKRVKYDARYIKNWSLAWDLKIIWLTLFSKHVYKNAH